MNNLLSYKISIREVLLGLLLSTVILGLITFSFNLSSKINDKKNFDIIPTLKYIA